MTTDLAGRASEIDVDPGRTCFGSEYRGFSHERWVVPHDLEAEVRRGHRIICGVALAGRPEHLVQNFNRCRRITYAHKCRARPAERAGARNIGDKPAECDIGHAIHRCEK